MAQPITRPPLAFTQLRDGSCGADGRSRELEKLQREIEERTHLRAPFVVVEGSATVVHSGALKAKWRYPREKAQVNTLDREPLPRYRRERDDA